MIDYIQNNPEKILMLFKDHLLISFFSLLIATIIGVSLGILIVKYDKLKKYVISIFNILRIIPSLAILILLIPVVGTGFKPALIALVLLGVPPILMNTVSGLDGVLQFMIETAYACGMSEFQVWVKVRIPLALPIIFTGIKTALIEIIASATLAARIGGGGLGEIIFTGLGLYRLDLLLLGGLSVAFLSLSANLLFILFDKLFFAYKDV
ncbi:MAG: ABC transporter permease [Erysipelotrichaceae bacterium]|nr:ABC transporter permease [Erysipelotrichaceae bacterium]